MGFVLTVQKPCTAACTISSRRLKGSETSAGSLRDKS